MPAVASTDCSEYIPFSIVYSRLSIRIVDAKEFFGDVKVTSIGYLFGRSVVVVMTSLAMVAPAVTVLDSQVHAGNVSADEGGNHGQRGAERDRRK